MDSIADRLSVVIFQNIPKIRRYTEMEDLTGIPATSWNKAINGRQRPTSDMLQAVARIWPEYAYWLITGVTDARNGHVSCRDGVGPFYPERKYCPRSAAKPYFLQTIEMFSHTYGAGNIYATELEERAAQLRLAQLDMAREAEERALSQAEGDNALNALKRAQTGYDNAEAHDPED